MTARGTKAGVIGWPVAHSLSPALHQYWLQRYGVEGSYGHYPVAPNDLKHFIMALADNGFVGINATLPHKEHVAQLMDRLGPAAQAVGAANTVVVEADGTLTGHSTDGFGFVANLRSAVPKLKLDSAQAVILGAGGAAMSILAALKWAGVTVTLCNRTRARAEALAALVGGIHVLPWGERSVALDACDLLINTTSLGMRGQPALEIDLNAMPRGSAVADCVYAPLQTALLKAAAAQGLVPVDGLGMLIHQARPAFKAWFGIDPEVTDELRGHLVKAQRTLVT